MTIDPETRHKTEFSTPDGHYQFRKMQFGLKNAQTVFNRVINKLLGRLPHVEMYFDDIIVHSKSFEQHVINVTNTLKTINKTGIKLQGAKCRWFSKKAAVLGHVVSKNKIEMDPSKIEALKNRTPSTKVKQLQQYLGIANYYRRFVKDFTIISISLTELLKSDKPFVWKEEQQAAFRALVNALTTYPILQQPDFKRPFILHTDASGYALGAVLGKKDELNREYACAYASRTLKGAEVHYGITEKECLGVVWAVRQFHIYVYGTKFTIVTDHSALTWLMGISDPTTSQVGHLSSSVRISNSSPEGL